MEITETPVVVGRGAHCSLVVDDPTVSTTHAEFVRRANSVYVKDLNSTNGTYVNGTRVMGEYRIQPSDAVQIGDVFFAVDGSSLRQLPPQIPQTRMTARQDVVEGTQPIPVATRLPSPDPGYLRPPMYIGRTLSGWTTGLLWAGVGMAGLLFLSSIFIFVRFEQAAQIDAGVARLAALDRWNSADTIYSWVYFFWILLSIAIFVLLVIWSFRAHEASNNLRPGERSWSRGWTVGGWFIPLANYILLPMILGEVHRIVQAPRQDERADPSWQRLPMPTSLILWFVFFGVGSLIHLVGMTVYGDYSSYDGIRVGLLFMLLGVSLLCGACVFAVWFINSVSNKVRPPRETQPSY